MSAASVEVMKANLSRLRGKRAEQQAALKESEVEKEIEQIERDIASAESQAKDKQTEAHSARAREQYQEREEHVARCISSLLSALDEALLANKCREAAETAMARAVGDEVAHDHMRIHRLDDSYMLLGLLNQIRGITGGMNVEQFLGILASRHRHATAILPAPKAE